MTGRAHDIAREHGKTLPAFSGQAEAERALYALRDRHLAVLEKIAGEQSAFVPDYRPESLRRLEQWYFDLCDADSFGKGGVARETFETCMAMYFGETAVRSANAEWVVKEYYLAPGRYELGVGRGLTTMMLHRFADHYREPSPRRRQSLFRLYTKYFAG